MNIEWEKYKAFLIEKLPAYAGKLNPAANWWEIDELKLEIGVDFPQEFTNVYAANDGEVKSFNYGEWGILCGSRMLSIEEIYDYFFLGADFENWIPIFKDREEDFYIGMDLFPNPNEKHGQISTFCPWGDVRMLPIAPSLSSFFKQINAYIERGFLYYSVAREKNNEVSVHDVREYFEHRTEDLVVILNGRNSWP